MASTSLSIGADSVPIDREVLMVFARWVHDNGAGEAFVVLPLPDGAATDSLSADALVVIDGASRLYPGGASDWFAFFAGLTGSAAREFNNAVRQSALGRPSVSGASESGPGGLGFP